MSVSPQDIGTAAEVVSEAVEEAEKVGLFKKIGRAVSSLKFWGKNKKGIKITVYNDGKIISSVLIPKNSHISWAYHLDDNNLLTIDNITKNTDKTFYCPLEKDIAKMIGASVELMNEAKQSVSEMIKERKKSYSSAEVHPDTSDA